MPECRESGGGVSNGNGLKGCIEFIPPGIIPGGGCSNKGCGCALRPSCGDIFLRKCGEWSFGFGLALWRLRDRLELNIILQPSTVHLCISRRCTAEKWIFNAPLSQNVFRQTLHWTRFLPVAGFINWVWKYKKKITLTFFWINDFVRRVCQKNLLEQRASHQMEDY